MAAAKKAVTDQLINVSNKYTAWENPEGINNPYDDKEYWNIAKYVDKLGKAEAFKWLSREKEITKYAEINPKDAQNVYSKTSGIVASNTDIFVND